MVQKLVGQSLTLKVMVWLYVCTIQMSLSKGLPTRQPHRRSQHRGGDDHAGRDLAEPAQRQARLRPGGECRLGSRDQSSRSGGTGRVQGLYLA